MKNTLCLIALLSLSVSILAGPPAWLEAGAWTRSIWPDLPPGETEVAPARLTDNQDGGVFRVTDVTAPTLTFFPAPDAGDQPRGAVLVCPGGGYHILAINHEGTEVAQWLNGLGMHAFVLQYRVPNKRTGALQDAQRALRLIRHHAGDWGVDPEHLGILGFSAGGHLSARTAGSFETSSYEAVDGADVRSARPDFAVLVYPAYLRKGEVLAEDIRITDPHPPVFLTHAEDDKNHIRNSLVYYRACLEAGVPAEMHLYPSGGHGYGMRPGKRAADEWPLRCAEWLTDIGAR